jgi:phosphoenolpyruvate carboxylase
MTAGLLTTPAEVREALDAFEGLGADEVMCYRYGRDADQVDRLADLL